MSTIAGLILYVAWRLIDVSEIIHLLRTSRMEAGILAITFVTGVFSNLEFAIYLGALVSLMVFLHNSSKPALVIGAPNPSSEQRSFANAQVYNLPECPSIIIIRFDGPIFFGSVDFINQEFQRIREERPHQTRAILILKGVGDVDHAGAEALLQEVTRRRSLGGNVFLVASFPPIIAQLKKFGLVSAIGETHLFENKRLAISKAVEDVPKKICQVCTKRIFLECSKKL